MVSYGAVKDRILCNAGVPLIVYNNTGKCGVPLGTPIFCFEGFVLSEVIPFLISRSRTPRSSSGTTPVNLP